MRPNLRLVKVTWREEEEEDEYEANGAFGGGLRQEEAAGWSDKGRCTSAPFSARCYGEPNAYTADVR